MASTIQFTGILGSVGARLARFQLAKVPGGGHGGRGYGRWTGWYLMADELRRARKRGKKKKKRSILDEDIAQREEQHTTSLALFLAEV